MATGSKNQLNTAPDSTEGLQLKRYKSPRCLPTSNRKAVIGLYGVPGAGKTFWLEKLKQNLPQEYFAFYEGSQVISSLVPGGLDNFQKLQDVEKDKIRSHAILMIQKGCAERGKVAIVAGHFMFWPEDAKGSSVCTQSDLEVYTHILYLDVSAELIVQRRLEDSGRKRPSVSVAHLSKWQQAEKTELRRLCREYGILFSPIFRHSSLLEQIVLQIRDFSIHSEAHNLSCAERRLDAVVAIGQGQLETMLVFDADKTLAAEDSGELFWEKACSSRLQRNEYYSPLKLLFSSLLRYSYVAFRQAMLMYEEEADDEAFNKLCQEVASKTTMYPEFVSLLRQTAKLEHVGAVIVTCGLQRVWQKVLDREGLSETVKIIGGGRISDGFVITAEVKAALVARLRETHNLYVWAFGDSPLDIEMLRRANQAIVVVGDEQARSRSMEHVLKDAIENDGLRARQIILPSHASPRLNTSKLPPIQLTDEFVHSVLCRRIRYQYIKIIHATDKNATKLLVTASRNSKRAGPALREDHRREGWYLAMEFVSAAIGLEDFPIPHVQGHYTNGHRLLKEYQTTIIALMRGGEAMAFGVNDAFPVAMFLHANEPSDVKAQYLNGQHTVVLVDSVINSGNTIVKFVQQIRSLQPNIRIVVVASVVHAESVSAGSEPYKRLAQALDYRGQLTIIALRLSDNRFTGSGTTDTGNRLFRTMYLP